jgi:hypothetical protein
MMANVSFFILFTYLLLVYLSLVDFIRPKKADKNIPTTTIGAVVILSFALRNSVGVLGWFLSHNTNWGGCHF